MNLRLLLMSHAPTAAMRAGRLPADDPLDARGVAQAHAARTNLPIADAASAFVSPAVCALETSAALGLNAQIDYALADIDYGNWRGQRLSDLARQTPDALAAWTREPDAVPHGGESFTQVVRRIGKWLDALGADGHAPGNPAHNTFNDSSDASDNAPGHTRHVVAITHAPVVRAAIVHALGAPAAIFSRIEVAPLTVVELRHSRQRGWTWWPASS